MAEPSLSEEEKDARWVRSRRQEDEAMSIAGRKFAKFARYTSYTILTGSALLAVLWDHIRALMKSAGP